VDALLLSFAVIFVAELGDKSQTVGGSRHYPACTKP